MKKYRAVCDHHNYRGIKWETEDFAQMDADEHDCLWVKIEEFDR